MVIAPSRWGAHQDRGGIVVERHRLATDKGKDRAPRSGLALAEVDLHKAREEAERLPHERQAATGQGCRAPALFRHWKGLDANSHSDDGMDGGGGPAGRHTRSPPGTN